MQCRRASPLWLHHKFVTVSPHHRTCDESRLGHLVWVFSNHVQNEALKVDGTPHCTCAKILKDRDWYLTGIEIVLVGVIMGTGSSGTRIFVYKWTERFKHNNIAVVPEHIELLTYR